MSSTTKSRGFTLIELLITTAVMGIIATIATLNVMPQMTRQRLTRASTQLVWTLQQQRIRAIKQRQPITLSFPNNHTYTVWTDWNNNSTSDSGEVQTSDLSTAYPGVTLSATANPILQPDGTVTNPLTVTLSNASGTKTVTMNIIGNIVIQ
jgi:type II secretion system protein H